MISDPWGRVDESGTVYVRTADGERVVGSWQAGSPEEALAYFKRKYDGLVVEIGLLERRVRTTDLSAKDAAAAIDHLRSSVVDAHAVGDLDALVKRLDALTGEVEARREERKAAKAKGIEVYTIRVEVNDSNYQVLQGCASKPDMFYDVKQASDLNSVFGAIAARIQNLRLSK